MKIFVTKLFHFVWMKKNSVRIAHALLFISGAILRSGTAHNAHEQMSYSLVERRSGTAHNAHEQMRSSINISFLAILYK